MLVKAKQLGFHDGHRVAPGEVFDFKGKRVPKWVTVVKAETVQEEVQPKGKKPAKIEKPEPEDDESLI